MSVLAALARKAAPAFRGAQTRQLATAVGNLTPDGIQFKGNQFPFRWLKDSCQCPHCVHPSTQQKLHRTSDVSPTSHAGPEAVKFAEDGVHVTWELEHTSFYPSGFLERYSSTDARRNFHLDTDVSTWDKQRIESAPNLFVSYDGLRDTSKLLSAMTQLMQYGLLFVTGVPNKETSNETCEAQHLAELFGELRETFYGRLWDVINVRNSTNIAYTNLDLGLHMDLLYFQHPPRYQQLHCLRNRVEGGTSVFVDAVHAANRLRETHVADFDVLATTPVQFHYVNAGNHLHEGHPTIELDHYADGKPVKFVNYSPPFQAPLPPSTPPAFYTALQRFVSLLEEPGAKYEYTLREGDAVLFDNRRVLHARTAFTDTTRDDTTSHGEPNRWLKGCYLEADALLNRARVLKRAEQSR